MPRKADRAAFAGRAGSAVSSSPAVQQPVQHGAFQDEQHTAVLATVSQPRTNEPPAANLQEQPRPICMQQPAAAEPAAQPDGSASAAPQPLSRDRLTVEVPAERQAHAAAAMQAVDGPVRSAVGSPGGQQWSDPLQTVRLPGHHPVPNLAFVGVLTFTPQLSRMQRSCRPHGCSRTRCLTRSDRHGIEQHGRAVGT